MAKKLDIDLDEVYELACKGYNVTMICSAIGITRTTAYNHRDIINTIKKGADKAKQDVVDHLMSRSIEDQSAAASIFLAKQLKVFDNYFTTSKPTNIQDALKRIATIYDLVAKSELDQEKADKLVGYLDKYIKAYETSELEKRIEALESYSQSPQGQTVIEAKEPEF